MAIQPSDYLSEAEQSLEHDTESGFRSAISRAYYAVYHTVLPKAINAGFDPKPSKDPSNTESSSTHVRLIKFIRTKDQATATRLSLMRDSRNEADYDFYLDIKKREARMKIDDCKRLISAIDKIPF